MNRVEVFEPDTLVFWVSREWHLHNPIVKYGLVVQQFASECIIDYLKFRKNTIIVDADYPDGVRWDDFRNTYKYHKLPKGWDYGMKLYDERDEDPDFYKKVRSYPINTDGITRAWHDGILAVPKLHDFDHLDTNITKDGYQVIMKGPYYGEDSSTGETVPNSKLYRTFEEAAKERDEIITEYKRQAALTDYEWSVEQIDKVLGLWKYMTSASQEQYDNVRSRLLAMKNVEDLVVRHGISGLQWKYEKNSRWSNIEPDAF